MLHKWASPVQWFWAQEGLILLNIHRGIKNWGWGGNWFLGLFQEGKIFSTIFSFLLFLLTFCHDI